MSDSQSKSSQDQIEQLTLLLDRKDSCLNHLKKLAQEQYERFNREKVQLNHIIEQLIEENNQLKRRHKSLTMGV